MDKGDIVQEAVIKTIPKKKKCKKAKWFSEEALQIAEKRKEKKYQKPKWLSEETLQIAVNRREVKGKGEKESYIHLKAEFQRIARRDKKPSYVNNEKE